MSLVNMKESKYTYVTFLLITGIVFYVMNTLTPLAVDDWHYKFIFGTQHQVNSILDIIHSQHEHYLKFNGRFIVHFFVQLFDGILGKDCFNLVNTFVFISFVVALALNLRTHIQSMFISSSIALFLIFFFIPGLQNVFLWMSGACNYLWAATFVLSFNLFLKYDFKSKLWIPALFVIGIICGWQHEGITIGYGTGCLIYYIMHRKEFTWYRAVLLTGFYIGVLMLVISPGSWHRLSATDGAFNVTSLLPALFQMDNIRTLPLLIVLLVVFARLRIINIKVFLTENIVECAAISINFLFVLATRHASAHSRFCFELFSMILILKLFSYVSIKSIWILISNGFLLLMTTLIIPQQIRNYNNYQRCLHQIASNKSEIVLTDDIECHFLCKRFVRDFRMSNDLDFHFEFMGERWIGNYFHRDKIRLISQNLYNDIVNKPSEFRQWNFSDSYPVYVKEYEDSCIIPEKITLVLKPTDFKSVPFYLRPFAHKMERYTVGELNMPRFDIIPINGKHYLFVGKTSVVKDRVVDIKIN